MVRKAVLEGSTQAAFIAISSRLVGSTFRFLETLNPSFQKTKVISDPSTVFVRELVTISMAWGFALLTHIVIKPLAQKRGWGNFSVQFLTALIGTSIAESLGRLIAYRGALKREKMRMMPKVIPAVISPIQLPSFQPQPQRLTLPIASPASVQRPFAYY